MPVLLGLAAVLRYLTGFVPLVSSGGSFGIFSGNVLGLALTAVQGDKHSKLLSVPRILTLSGKR
ncbi:MAG: hypothetical protein RAM38_15985, partial [Arsenophonus sp.]|nr:hypothetical protein [Arsenophonus sp.]